jgi:hypothetical protein
MMKKKYMTPDIEVVKIVSHVSLLAGSDLNEFIQDIDGETSTGWADAREENFELENFNISDFE